MATQRSFAEYVKKRLDSNLWTVAEHAVLAVCCGALRNCSLI